MEKIGWMFYYVYTKKEGKWMSFCCTLGVWDWEVAVMDDIKFELNMISNYSILKMILSGNSMLV